MSGRSPTTERNTSADAAIADHQRPQSPPRRLAEKRGQAYAYSPPGDAKEVVIDHQIGSLPRSRRSSMLTELADEDPPLTPSNNSVEKGNMAAYLT
jgi:hypothetical protein